MKYFWMALAAARVLCAADFALQEYLPPETRVVMGLRVGALRESSLFQQQAGSAKSFGETWTQMAAFMGFDPLHDIDDVLLTSAADRENAPALLVLRGHFNLDRLSSGAQRYRGVAMRSDGKKGGSVLALIDAETALAGDPALVKAAIDRRGQAVVFDQELLARVAALRERFDLWGTGERPQGFVAPGGQNDQFNSIDRFEFGMRITHGLEFAAEVHARSAKDAEKLAGTLALFEAMAKTQSKDAQFDVKLEDSTLKLKFAISEEELQKAIAATQKSSTQQSSTPKVTGQPVSTAPATQVTSPGGTSTFILPGKR